MIRILCYCILSNNTVIISLLYIQKIPSNGLLISGCVIERLYNAILLLQLILSLLLISHVNNWMKYNRSFLINNFK